MSSESWFERSRILSSAGLVVLGSKTKDKLEKLTSILPLIEAAHASGVVLLDSDSIDNLLSLVPNVLLNEDSIPIRKLEQATLAKNDNPSPIGRIIASPQTQLEVAPRPHGLPHFSKHDFPMDAREIDSDIEIHFDITGKSVTEGSLLDIQNCFTSRLTQLRNLMISGNVLPRRPISNSDAWRNRHTHSSSDYETTLVGLVGETRWSRKGNLGFNIEDETGKIRCSLKTPSNASEFHASMDGLMDDEVIGISGYFIGDRDPLFLAQDIHHPPLKDHIKTPAGIDRAVSAAFLSDIHLGSKTFLATPWEKMIHWFKNDPMARTIKYFVLSGDGVDGIGIYPGQDKHLAIKDLYKQYSELARLLEEIPDWIDIIILPGNHDAVRPAEPQPSLDPEIQQDYSDAVFVGNPCDFSLHGVRVLSYHGKSIDDFVATLRSVSYSKPELAMKAMLERRHLAPSWGNKTPLSPEPEDNMVIRQTPDIFVTGHVHGHYMGNHKGVTLLHSSTWQDQTDFQKMLGFQPKPCILSIVNLHTFATFAIPFV